MIFKGIQLPMWGGGAKPPLGNLSPHPALLWNKFCNVLISIFHNNTFLLLDECLVSQNPQSLDVKLSSLRRTMNQDLILVLGSCGTPDLKVLRVAQFSVIPESGNIRKELKRYIEYSGSSSMSKVFQSLLSYMLLRAG